MAETEHAGGKLRYTRAGDVGRIVFANPDRLNAMTLAMWDALAEVAEAAARDERLRVLTLEGAGTRAFVAGADISEFGDTRSDSTTAARYGAAVERAEAAVGAVPVPTLALIRGYCIGGGLGIAIRCDLRLADDAARFAVTPARLGLGYGPEGVAAIQRVVGPSLTADMLYTARQVPADEALSRGLCDRVFPAPAFAAESAAVVERIAANAPLTLRAIKGALRDLARPEAQRDPGAVAALVRTCFDSADYAEGQAAFAEKRAPVFRGT